MNKCKNFDIVMIRGDTLEFDFEVEGISELTSAFFSCKSNLGSNDYIFQKSLGMGITPQEDGIFNVKIEPEDTKNVSTGNYHYDLEINVNGNVYTILKGMLTIDWDVTR